MIEIKWEISAIEAPSVVSPPYAAGKTTVLSPNGIAVAQSATLIISLSVFKRSKIIINTAGKIIRRIKEARYTFLLLASLFSLYSPITKPVSSIASGDIQAPAEETAEVINFGRGTQVSPHTAPSINEIKIGLTKDLGLILRPPCWA